jgi:hypothetical protein
MDSHTKVASLLVDNSFTRTERRQSHRDKDVISP